METLLPLIIAPVILVILAAIFFLGYALGRWGGIQLRENEGEARVRHLLTNSFKAPDYHLLSNITIPFEGGTTQIDHILVSTRGIFVLETKHYSGWIYADEKNPRWTQVIYRIKNRFANPVFQNYRHVKAIRSLLDFVPKEHIHPLVVFTGKAVFKTYKPDDVVYLARLKERIGQFNKDTLTQQDQQLAVGRLECKRYEISKQTDIEHIAYLNKKYGRN